MDMFVLFENSLISLCMCCVLMCVGGGGASVFTICYGYVEFKYMYAENWL